MEKQIVKKQAKKGSTEQMGQAQAFIKALALAFSFTCIVFIIYAVILTYTNASEAQIPMVSTVTTAVSCMLAGYVSAKGAKSRGLFWGIGAGLLYAVLLFLLGVFAGAAFTLSMGKLTTLLIAVAGGGIGGVLGINRK